MTETLSSVFAESLGSLARPVRSQPHVTCVIPAYNEEQSVESVLDALLRQTRLPDSIHLLVNNTTDLTIDVANRWLAKNTTDGRYVRSVRGEVFRTHIRVHDLGMVADKKVGALNFGYRIAVSEAADYLFGVDGDTQVMTDCLEHLVAEIHSDSRIGGVSAIYSVARRKDSSPLGKFLTLGQRQDFAGFNLDNLLHGRNMAVLGGQASIFNMEALSAVMIKEKQTAPWVRDSAVEDSKLSLQIKDAGYKTKISAKARAYVDPMLSLKSLDAQRLKWQHGFIDLFWPGERGNIKGQPLHSSLRLRWYESVSMLVNIFSRFGFLLLFAASVSIDSFIFRPVWLIPPLISILLNLRIAMSMHDKKIGDILYAALLIPSEVYIWIRAGHFIRSWFHFFARPENDTWALQANAEAGRGNKLWMAPMVGFLAAAGLAVYWWTNSASVTDQGKLLAFGWPVLFLLTIIQSAFMLRKLFRRHRSLTV